MSTFFSSDWEAGTGILDSVWTGDTDAHSILSVSADQFFTGAHSLKCIQANYTAYLYKTFAAIATIGLRFAVRIHTAPVYYTILGELGGGPMSYIRLYPTTFYVDNGTGSAIGTPFTFALDTWYQIELLYTNGNTTLAWRVWNAGGSKILAGPYSGTPHNPATIGEIYVGPVVDPDTATFWLDSLVADNAAYPGPIVTATSFYPMPSFKPGY